MIDRNSKDFNPINPDKFYDITEMTAQEVFEASMDHLIEQGERSTSEGEGCMYDAGNGLMCAAAIFIPNYSVNLEFSGWGDLVTGFGVPSDYQSLIKRMQIFHDEYLTSYGLECVQKFLDRTEVNYGVDASKYTAEQFSAYLKEES